MSDRSAETLQGNLAIWVSDEARVQTDGWKGYASIPAVRHYTVNHSKQFVCYKKSRKISINALEGAHGVIKPKARTLNMFVGHPTQQKESLQKKLDELVFRFNNRNLPDFFLVFFVSFGGTSPF